MTARIEWLGQPAGKHARARETIVAAIRAVFGREPTLLEAQFAQAVACVETGGEYDAAYYVNKETGDKIFGSHNWGAMHCAENPPCPPGCFEATDVGQNCFMRFSSVDEGVRAFIRTLYVRRSSVLRAANTGSTSAVASAMKQTGYFTAPLADYEDGLNGCLQRIAAALGEQAPVSRGISVRGLLPPLLLIGAGVALFWGTLATPARRALSRLTR